MRWQPPLSLFLSLSRILSPPAQSSPRRGAGGRHPLEHAQALNSKSESFTRGPLCRYFLGFGPSGISGVASRSWYKPTQGPSWGYLKVNFSEMLSIFGDKRPRNGSNNGEMAPRTGTGCPHIGPFVDAIVRVTGVFLTHGARGGRDETCTVHACHVCLPLYYSRA